MRRCLGSLVVAAAAGRPLAAGLADSARRCLRERLTSRHLEADPVAGLGGERPAHAVDQRRGLHDGLAQHEVGEGAGRTVGTGSSSGCGRLLAEVGDHERSRAPAVADGRPVGAPASSSWSRSAAVSARPSATRAVGADRRAARHGEARAPPARHPGHDGRDPVLMGTDPTAADEPADPLPALLDRRLGAEHVGW